MPSSCRFIVRGFSLHGCQVARFHDLPRGRMRVVLPSGLTTSEIPRTKLAALRQLFPRSLAGIGLLSELMCNSARPPRRAFASNDANASLAS